MGQIGRPLSESLGLVLASPNSLLVREVSCAWGMKEKAAQGGCGETGKYEAPMGLPKGMLLEWECLWTLAGVAKVSVRACRGPVLAERAASVWFVRVSPQSVSWNH